MTPAWTRKLNMSGPPPVLGLPAVLHPEDVDPVDGGLLPGRGDADKLALVGAGVGRPGGHQVPLGDHVVDLGVQVGEGLLDQAEELLGLLGALAAEGVVNPSEVSSSSMASRFRALMTSW